MKEFFSNMFEDVAEMSLGGWLLMAVLLAGGIAAFVLLRRKSGKSFWTARTMSVGAMCMALASVLSLIKLLPMPMGGSLTPASMLPLLLFAYVYGTVPGLTLGALYGVMQFILDGGQWLWTGAIPNLLDYPIAFGLLGLAGLFNHMENETKGLSLGFLLGCFGRFLASFTSGVVFYAEWAPEGMHPAVYSAGYNAAYMLPECILCIAIGIGIAPRLVRELRKVK